MLRQPPCGAELARLLAPWQQIVDKADAFFRQTAARYPDQLRCQEGCAACCQQDLSLSLVEALAVLAARDAGALADMARPSTPAGQAPAGSCAFLVAERCAVYPGRPLICRTHGLMILQREDAAAGQAPQLSVCPQNFTDGPPAADSILDGALLASALAVADGMARQVLGLPGQRRYPISQLAALGWAALAELELCHDSP